MLASSEGSAERGAIIDAGRTLSAAGLNRGTSGNVSARLRIGAFDGFLVTPTGMACDSITTDDLVAVTLDGAASGRRLPSSEWQMHRDLYRARADVHAIVHAHAPFATALACAGRSIPPFHYMVAIAGGRDIRCARYATFGSAELAAEVVAAMRDRRACLLAHHGMLAAGADVGAALALAVEVEGLAEVYWRALQIGEPQLLADDEMDRVLVKFRTYGQQDRT